MSFLFENPYLIMTVGVFFIAMFGYLFVNTRKKIALVGLGVVLALTLACLAIEHFVETPQEQVEASLDKLAEELEANNLEGVLACLDPTCTKGQEEARYYLGKGRITKAKVTDLTIKINQSTSPPSAEVKFTGVIGGVSISGDLEKHSVPVKFTATLWQHGDRWLVADYNYKLGMHN